MSSRSTVFEIGIFAIFLLLARNVDAIDFTWNATADPLGWFEIDMNAGGGLDVTGWVTGSGPTGFVPDDAGDTATIEQTGRTVTLNSAVTVGTVNLGTAAPAMLSLDGGTITIVDAFNIRPGGELQLFGGTTNVTGGLLNNSGLIHGITGGTVRANVTNAEGGTVQADAGATVNFATPGTNLTNKGAINTLPGGIITIANGVTLNLDGGIIDNRGQIEVGNGALNFNAGSFSGNPIELTGSTLNLNSDVDAASFQFAGGTFNGNIRPNQSVRHTLLNLVTPNSFANAGTLELAGTSSSSTNLIVGGEGIVTNMGLMHMVAELPRGLTRVVNGTIDNQNDLVLDPSVRLTVDQLNNSGSTVVGAGASMVSDAGSNSGTMAFEPGSHLTVNRGTFDHAAGNTMLDGEWEINSGATLNYLGGTISGEGQIRFNNSTLNLSPGRGPMHFEFAGGTINGNIDANQSLRHTSLDLIAPDSFVNAGMLELAGTVTNTTRINIFGGGVLTNTGTLRAIAELPRGLNRAVQGEIDNQGDITIGPSVSFTANGLTNTGTVNMGPGASLKIQNGHFNQNGGTINNAGASITSSTVNFNGGEILGAPLLIGQNSSLNFGPDADGDASFQFADGGSLNGTIGPNTTVTLLGQTVGTQVYTSNGSLTNEGTLHLDQSAGGAVQIQVNGLELTNEPSGTISGNGS